MKKHCLTGVALSIVLLMIRPAPVYAIQQLTVVGEAYHLADGSLAYRELHYESLDGMDRTVVYEDHEQQAIAKKSIDYRPGKLTPAFSQRNWLYPETIDVLWQESGLRIQYSVEDSKPKDKQIKVKTPLVIDAGFDHFIRDSWTVLMGQQAVDFYFPAVSRQSLIELRAKQQSCPVADEDKVYWPGAASPGTEDTKQVCFSISPANWLISALLDDIELAYDSESRQLRSFRGLANIADASGKGMKVEIRYIYPGELGFPADIDPLATEPK